MKRFKGTKGIWSVVHSKSKRAWNIVNTKLGEKYKIARCPYLEGLFYRESEETKANALLMSKAPEMLKELIVARDAMWELLEFQEGWEDDLQRIDQLIKEATEI